MTMTIALRAEDTDRTERRYVSHEETASLARAALAARHQ
jgi:hypothetical protein